MITFVICLALLVASYFTYGRYLERRFGADDSRPAPCRTHYDGVDYLPLPTWKAFLIQLLNIAGLGPIFGALLGATYGPVAFLWITLGGIFMGAVQDYFSGMISMENKGLSLPEIVGKYLGLSVKQVMRGFTVALMVLVGAVFMSGPAGLLAGLSGLTTLHLGGITIPNFWVWVILVYYVVATLLPIDKIIGRIYPVFGAALLFMAIGILGAIFFGGYAVPELTLSTLTNMKSNAADFPIVPTLFVTIACGAISGFHATQSPMIARCLTRESHGRPVFFGAMIAESAIALIWAAVGMSFFGGVHELGDALAAHDWSAAWAVDTISHTTLGRIGGLLAILGVVAAPISTGDTAFRSARLIVADFLHIKQTRFVNRLCISVPLFIIGYVITLLRFDVVWRYFAWANQTLAVAALWTIAVYLLQRRQNCLVALLPALFMTFITTTYLFTAVEMIHANYLIGIIVAGALTLALLLLFCRYAVRHGDKMGAVS
ncbi:carbon starvation protein CstA [Bacteroidia bacterium]|nr:carbon starvation protein CstA [Bacteroidia bacterium]